MLAFLFLAPLSLAQVNGQFKPTKVTRSNNIILLDGIKYYMHEVKEGHTLYSVSKAYNVSQKILGEENPNVPHISSGTLPLGLVIRIPFVEAAESSPEIERDLEHFSYHVIKPKETLSSLSRLYKIHYKKIIEHNPGVENNLPIGMEVKIPKAQLAAVGQTNTVPVALSVMVPDTSYIYHKVKKGQNTIRIAKLYGIKVRDLKKSNPGIRWSLAENEIIRIPKNLITNLNMLPVVDEEIKTDEIITLPDEDEGEDPELITNPDCLEFLYPHDDQVFEVAFLLPLYLEANDTLHINDTLPYSSFDIYEVMFLEFLEGAYMAIDSLRHFGLTMNINVYDTERDPLVVKELFESGKLDDADLLIGPVYSNPLGVASDYSKRLEIPMVSPLSSRGRGLDENPYLFQANPGNQIQYELASQYLANFYDMNIIMVQDTSSMNPAVRKSGSKIFDYLTYQVNPEDLMSGKTQFHPAFSDELPEKALMAPVEDMLSMDRENLILIPSVNKIFVTDIINKLNALALHYDITVFGRPEWGSNEALELEYLYNLKLHYYTNFSNPYVNYSDSLTLEFCKQYRMNWNNEPSKFSFQGFDITYYFFKALYLYGNEFVRCINCWKNVLIHPSMQTEFHFQRINSGVGFENQALSIVRYNPETLMKEKIRSTIPVRVKENQEDKR